MLWWKFLFGVKRVVNAMMLCAKAKDSWLVNLEILILEEEFAKNQMSSFWWVRVENFANS